MQPQTMACERGSGPTHVSSPAELWPVADPDGAEAVSPDNALVVEQCAEHYSDHPAEDKPACLQANHDPPGSRESHAFNGEHRSGNIDAPKCGNESRRAKPVQFMDLPVDVLDEIVNKVRSTPRP